MAFEIPGQTRGWIAGGTAGTPGSDLSIGATVNSIVVDSFRYLFVKFSGGVLVPVTAGGDFAVGVLQNKPAPGQVGTVMISGVTRVKSNDATIVVGSTLYMDAFGFVKATATSANHPIGISEENAPSSGGFTIAMCLKPFGNVWA